MTFQEMTIELKRLDAIKIPRTDTELKERQALETELWRKYSWMMAHQWTGAVSWVIDRHKTHSLPTVDEFGKAVAMMREKGVIKTEACRSCGGLKMKYIRVQRASTGEVMNACKPCSVCMVAANWELKPDLIEIPDDESHEIRLAKALSPKQAYWVIHKAEAANITIPEETRFIILDKAAQYEADIEEKRSKTVPAAQAMTIDLSGIKVVKAPEREQAALSPVADGSSEPEFVDWEAEA